MPIHYYCRHCSTKMGTINDTVLNEEQLGIHTLTNEEKQDMVSYGSDGDIHIQSICDDCHEAFKKNPDLHQYDYLIH
ncbi:anti-sigma-F factor Fin family protein [Lederbergia citri]|uniref:Anti-sigma-F factor Fin family protein n=1 Tax=Lederbergia citri TaxID=2833580 RepID=A0A942YI69_9BACI|nr:anti-sigma-F factor Fin family protein [Lederbergia citri]MBS4198018.1 anti-sigma-F factor Fin family protein [Lederbergia citri]